MAANKPSAKKVENPVSSPKEASKAAQVLNNPKASKEEKSLAAGVLVNARHHPTKK